MDQKSKEPLLAVIWSILLPGLGQIYAGRLIRGIVFLVSPLIVVILAFLYVINRNTPTSPSLISFVMLFVGFNLYIMIDAYYCVKAYNAAHKLEREIKFVKSIIFIVVILIFSFVFNPSCLISKGIGSYIKQNCVQVFKMSAGSMSPTLLNGDSVFADKTIYKKSDPQRGDLVVFIYPRDRKIDFIKRIAGLPNEIIEIKNGGILINGKPIEYPSARKHFYYYNRGAFGMPGKPIKIPQDSYFVLGDNSRASLDSRYWGFVPRKDILGKVYKILYPFDRSGPI